MVERTDGAEPRGRENLVEGVPAGRAAEPEEVAELVAFLAIDKAGYLNSAAVPVDGGWTAV